MIWLVLSALLFVLAGFMIFSLGWNYGFSRGRLMGFDECLLTVNQSLLRYRDAWSSRGQNIDDLR